MRTAWTLAVALFVCVSPSVASTTLYPEPSGWGSLNAGSSLDDRRAEVDAMAVIAAAMPEGFGPDLRVRLIADRVGRGTELIALQHTAAGYRIVAAWSAAWLKHNPKSHVTRCTANVERELGEAIIASWKTVLLATSYAQRPDFGTAGEDDHFAMSLTGRWLAGWAYAPASPTPPGRLKDIAVTMKAVCVGDDASTRQKLQTELSDFLKS